MEFKTFAKVVDECVTSRNIDPAISMLKSEPEECMKDKQALARLVSRCEHFGYLEDVRKIYELLLE